MAVLRFRRNAGLTIAELTKQMPAGSLTSISVPEPAQTIDITCTAGGVNDATAYMTSLGYTLVGTDPAATIQQEASTAVTPSGRIQTSDGVVLTAGIIADGNTIVRSGSTFVGRSVADTVAFDHFVTGNLDLDELGIMGWRTNVAGTGADIALNGEIGHPGIIDFGAGTAEAGRSAIHLGEAGAGLLNFLLNATQGEINHEWLVRFNANALSSANHDYASIGWGDAFDATGDVEHNNGIYCEFAPGTSANFQLVVANGGSRNRSNSSIAVSGNVWYRIGLNLTYPGNVPTAKLLINGTVRATTTATFPSTGVGIGARIDCNATANEARMQVDYMFVTQVTNKET